ncbi:uncharacterized protein [Leptinotarsa decemlineata]|uniref:uncharacterized protein n=1 Tax=Leptinotarsa decemlineata TaxID=7539 RepID=UPI003D30A1CD
MNTQHPAWGSGISNRQGSQLLELVEEHGLVKLNDGSPTRLTAPGINASAPDIAMCSPQLSHSIDWIVLPDAGMSDHFPFLCCLNDRRTSQSNTTQHRQTFNTKKADWFRYEQQLLNQIHSGDIPYEDLAAMVLDAADSAIPKKSPAIGTKPQHHWWDADCKQQLQQGNSHFENTKTILICKIISMYVRVWSSVRKFANSRQPSRRNPSLNNDIAEVMLQSLTQPLLYSITPMENPHIQPSIPFNIDELHAALWYKRDTAPGLDLITYSMLQHLPQSGFASLLNIFNRLLNGSITIPMEWKRQLLCLIPKPGKDISTESGWRPITLTSCPG